jgi:hypothetical protein
MNRRLCSCSIENSRSAEFAGCGAGRGPKQTAQLAHPNGRVPAAWSVRGCNRSYHHTWLLRSPGCPPVFAIRSARSAGTRGRLCREKGRDFCCANARPKTPVCPNILPNRSSYAEGLNRAVHRTTWIQPPTRPIPAEPRNQDLSPSKSAPAKSRNLPRVARHWFRSPATGAILRQSCPSRQRQRAASRDMGTQGQSQQPLKLQFPQRICDDA